MFRNSECRDGAAVLDALDADRVVLVGNDSGGGIAQIFSALLSGVRCGRALCCHSEESLLQSDGVVAEY